MAKKFLTLSFDDGSIYDRRLVALFNQYGLKCTFNLNVGLFGESCLLEGETYAIRHTRVNLTEVRRLYEGHEIAGHGMKHPDLTRCSRREIIHQVEDERRALSTLAGYKVRGFAYPGGSLYGRKTVEILKRDTGIEYARNMDASMCFVLPDNWYEWRPTIFHGSPLLMETARRFLETKSEEDMLLYVWGNAYELEAWQSWNVLEEFCKMVSGREDVIYVTNIEVKDMICGGVQ